ncbi:unnamed protein product, partial [Adineta steineri]
MEIPGVQRNPENPIEISGVRGVSDKISQVQRHGVYFAYGGGGIVLSRPLALLFSTYTKKCKQYLNMFGGDEMIGKCVMKYSVWQYAVRDDNPNYSVCCLCSDNKRISTHNGSTTTLRKQLILKHNKADLVLSHIKRQRNKMLLNPIKKQELHQ